MSTLELYDAIGPANDENSMFKCRVEQYDKCLLCIGSGDFCPKIVNRTNVSANNIQPKRLSSVVYTNTTIAERINRVSLCMCVCV